MDLLRGQQRGNDGRINADQVAAAAAIDVDFG